MPDIFDIDYDQQSVDLFPPDKRFPKNIGFVRSLMKSIQWSRDLILGSYKSGSSAPIWSSGFYNKYDQVIYKKKVYSSLIDNNTGEPVVTFNWELVQEDFIGADERVKFNSQKIVLEYSLNKRFGGIFRPPVTMVNSDIYITLLPPSPYGFLIGQTIGSSVGRTTSSDFIGYPLPFKRLNNFQINVLNSLYIQTNEKEIRNFADKYVAAGLNYTVVSY